MRGARRLQTGTGCALLFNLLSRYAPLPEGVLTLRLAPPPPGSASGGDSAASAAPDAARRSAVAEALRLPARAPAPRAPPPVADAPADWAGAGAAGGAAALLLVAALTAVSVLAGVRGAEARAHSLAAPPHAHARVLTRRVRARRAPRATRWWRAPQRAARPASPRCCWPPACWRPASRSSSSAASSSPRSRACCPRPPLWQSLQPPLRRCTSTAQPTRYNSSRWASWPAQHTARRAWRAWPHPARLTWHLTRHLAQTRNLATPIAIHALFNGGVLALYAAWVAGGSGAGVGA
jgi:hypothetical protein